MEAVTQVDEVYRTTLSWIAGEIYSVWIPSNGYELAEIAAVEAYIDSDLLRWQRLVQKAAIVPLTGSLAQLKTILIV